MFELIGLAIKGVTGFVERKQEIAKAADENAARLLRETGSHNHDWEMASLQDKDKWLRRGSFLMFAFPMFWAAFDPQAVQAYFDVALKAMPEWYVQMFGAMVGGVWGVAALKNSVPGMIGGIRAALSQSVPPAPR